MIKLIAEISMNHMGEIALAKEMINAAKESGADYAKFQTWKVNNLKSGPWDIDGRREMYVKSELTEQMHFELSEYCKQVGILFLTSCFNITDLEMIGKYCRDIKIPSPECSNHELVRAASEKFIDVFVSTGASKLEEFISYRNIANVTVLHCVSCYPCPPDKVNLPRIALLKNLFKKVGYSGHYAGIWDAIAAISLGARVIEKHFTIDRDLPFTDNKYALLPHEFKTIREYDNELGWMSIDHGSEFQTGEEAIRELYRGRWC